MCECVCVCGGVAFVCALNLTKRFDGEGTAVYLGIPKKKVFITYGFE